MANQDVLKALPINILDHCPTGVTPAQIMSGSKGIELAMNPALDEAKTSGRSVYIPNRDPGGSTPTYVTTANATINNPGVTVYGNDATIRKVGTGPLFSTKAADKALNYGELLNNATKGSKVVTLKGGQAALAGISVGDWVVVMDRTAIYTGANAYRAEFQLIQAIDPAANPLTGNDIVTFWAPLVYDYTAGAVSGGRARIVKPTLISDVAYHDLNIIMDRTVNVTTYPDGHHAFDNRWLYNARFQNIRIRDLLNSGIRLQNCLNCSVANLDLNVGGSADTGNGTPTSSEGLPGFSYGVCETGLNLGLKVSAVTASNLRHLYTTTGLAFNASGVPADYGEPVGSLISDCVHSHAINAGFDTHEAGQNITFQDCKVVGGHFVGMQIRSKGTTVRNFEAHDTIGAAIWIRGRVTGGIYGERYNGYADLTVIDGVLANRTNLGVSFDNMAWPNRGAIIDEAPRSRISNVHARFVGGPALEMFQIADGKYAQIDALDPCQVTTSAPYVISARDLVAGTVLDINGVTNSSSDAKVTNLVKLQSTGGAVRLRDVEATEYSGTPVTTVGAVTVDTSLTVQRYDSKAQCFRQFSDSTGHFIQSFSPSAASPKNFVIDVKTDSANSAPTGDLQFYAQVNGVKGVGSDQTGRILQQGSVIFDANRLPVIRAYTVASLPATASTGTLAFASNGRAFNGTGTLESAGAGTGVLVTRVGAAWKVVGTNQTVSA